MQLNPVEFNAHLEHMGQDVKWRKASTCPCISPTSGAPKPKCTHCGGKGQLWGVQIPTVVGVASQKIQQEWARMGQWESGDSVISIPESSPMYEMGKFDRVLLVNSKEQFSMAMVHGGVNEKFLFTVDKIKRVFWIDGTDAIVEGKIPTVGTNGIPVWAPGDEPAPGQQYSINGTKVLEFFCFGQYPSNREEHQGARLPKRVVLRRFDLFGRDGRND